jgi:hypothetical protein
MNAFLCPAYLILLDLITLITCGEEYTQSSSALYNFLQLSVTSASYGSNNLLRTSFPDTFSLYSS